MGLKKKSSKSKKNSAKKHRWQRYQGLRFVGDILKYLAALAAILTFIYLIWPRQPVIPKLQATPINIIERITPVR